LKVYSINNLIPQKELEPIGWRVSGSFVMLEYSGFTVVYNDQGREVIRISEIKKSIWQKLKGIFYAAKRNSP
jgi:hypothetical protein